MDSALLAPRILLSLYLVLFGGAALVCFGSLRRASRIDDSDSRRGLVGLLVLSGGWALSHVGYLAAPTVSLQYAFFVAGLVVGLAAVGPWLYFCSAYTGRSLHRNRTVRWTAVGVYLAILAIKLTNPFHGQYFTTEVVTEPFTYLAIHHGPLHWVVMGLAYALAFVGIFMLFELFDQVSYDTKPLVVVVALTGFPVAFDILGSVTPFVLEFTYSPLGVAAFAIGVFYVYLDRFELVRLTGENDSPLILLDAEDCIRDYNRAARDLFPSLDGGNGQPLSAVAPSISERLDGEDEIIEIGQGSNTRYYRVSTNPFTADAARLGQMITLTDVSHREQYRRRLQRQNERLEQFAGLISHDLRNPLSVAKGRVELALEDDDPEHLSAAADALERMEELIEDLLTLARTGRNIDELQPVRIEALTVESWEMVETRTASLDITDSVSMTVEADPERLQQLFENLFRNAVEHGGHDVTVTVGELDGSVGFYVEDDGAGFPDDSVDRIFDPGFSTTERGTGFGLLIVQEIVAAHGWEIRATESTGGGARFEIRVPKA